MNFDENSLQRSCLEASKKELLRQIKQYDEQMRPVMQTKGYQYIQSSERTVAFLVAGEVRFRRRRYKKGDDWCVPVDEALGLRKNSRYSEAMIQVIAKCALLMPYAKTAKFLSEIYDMSLGSTTVNKVVKLYHDRLIEQRTYQYYQEDETTKRKVPIIYIEGDGIYVKAKANETTNRKIELSHFVIHEGVQPVKGKRLKLINKHEIMTFSPKEARQQVLDYLYNTYIITAETILVTNSDGGLGYTPYVFKEIAKALKVKRHEHFYDAYHVSQMLKQVFRAYSKELLEQAFKAIACHDKQLLRQTFETAENLLSPNECFQTVKTKLLNQFQYIKPAHLRGLSHRGIGVMESQHRKITYRTKRRGMYWTRNGIEIISQMILMAEENTLEEFFSKEWHKAYQKLKHLETLSADSFKEYPHEDHTLPKSKHNPYVQYRYY